MPAVQKCHCPLPPLCPSALHLTCLHPSTPSSLALLHCRGIPLPLYDYPAWSDASGAEVWLPRPPGLDGENGWFVVRLTSTDDEGWMYATAFNRLQV